MPVVLSPEEVKKYEAQRKLDEAEQPSFKEEFAKTLASLALNITVIILLVYGALNGPANLSTQFMSLLGIVIGAIFGVTATQIEKK
jgi:uncharacterized membrane-anchored protein